jgi:sugar/nucleoside kinase (ribokinase family)
MSLLVTGTIGIDTVETPCGHAENVLGGSAAYFACAAALFGPVRLVGVVGEDFPREFLDTFKGRPIDTAGLEIRPGAKTFRWSAKYLDDINERQTISTDLNVISEAAPRIPPQFQDSAFVFLANTHPAIQHGFIQQLSSPSLIVCDTMNLWIDTARDQLVETLSAVHGVVLNDAEARSLTAENDLIHAAKAILKLGPAFVVVKKGEHGAMLVTPEEIFTLPAYPSMKVKDPTGAGDSFAGGMMAHLAATGRTDPAALKAAIARGTCVASLTIEDFSLNALAAANQNLVLDRLAKLKSMTTFE